MSKQQQVQQRTSSDTQKESEGNPRVGMAEMAAAKHLGSRVIQFKVLLIGLAVAFLCIAATMVQASVIASHAPSSEHYSSGVGGYNGQSVTTPAGGPWNNLTFNFVNRDGNPVGAGDLYLLSERYTSTPPDLNYGTSGFIATSSGNGSVWNFAADVKLNPNTKYWFYSKNNLPSLHYSNDGPDQYTGGEMQTAGAAAHQTFGDDDRTNSDLEFSLSGTVVPEPSTLLLGMLGLAGFALVRRRLRSIS